MKKKWKNEIIKHRNNNLKLEIEIKEIKIINKKIHAA